MTIEELTFEAFKQGREQGREEGAAEIKRLRALVETGYCEGYEDGEYGGGGPLAWCWENSNTYAALQPKEGNP